jgi:hypothetical protein
MKMERRSLRAGGLLLDSIGTCSAAFCWILLTTSTAILNLFAAIACLVSRPLRNFSPEAENELTHLKAGKNYEMGLIMAMAFSNSESFLLLRFANPPGL